MRETIAKLEERINQLEKRLEKSEDLMGKMHELTACVSGLTVEIKNANVNMKEFIASNEKRSSLEDTRVDDLEELVNERFQRQGERIGALAERGAKKFETIIATVITVIITAVIMYFVGRITGR